MKDRIRTRFTEEYGVEHPIALAAMAFVGTPPGLAIAVSKAGGLGSVGAGLLPPDALREVIGAVRQAVAGTFNVNFLPRFTGDAHIDVCIETGVPVVSFHWDRPPRAWVDRLHAAGVKVWEQVGSVDQAKRAVDAGIDLIVAQGSEAGGHNYGTLPLFVLVPAIVEAVAPVPVLASGGIATGRQLAAALALGADGGWIGTRFIASEEAYAHPLYKQRIVEATPTQTRRTGVYGPDMPDFNPMRVLDMGIAREYAGRESEAPGDLESQPVVATMSLGGQRVPLHRFSSFLPTPDTEGDIDALPYAAGQGAGLVHEILPVREIVDRLVREAMTALAQYGDPGGR